MTVLLSVGALAAAFLVAGRGADAVTERVPGTRVVVPAGEARDALADPFGSDLEPDLGPALEPDLGPDLGPEGIGPETVPEIPDPPDGGGLVPDGPDESGTADADGLVREVPDTGAPDAGVSVAGAGAGALAPADTVFGSPVDALTGGR